MRYFLAFFCLLLATSLSAQMFTNSKDWSSYTDQKNGGSSTILLKAQTETLQGKSTFVVSAQGEVTTKYTYGFTGLILSPPPKVLKEIQMSGGVQLTILGDGQAYRFRAETSDVKDYDFYGFVLQTQAGEPLIVKIPFSSLTQESWGVKVPFDPHHITQLSFQTVGQPLASYQFKLYNFHLLPSP